MKIHFVGSLGVSMRVLSSIMQNYGHDVTGSDITLCGHDKKNVSGADFVVYTAAVGEDNVEVIEARRQDIPVMERAEFLGRIARNYKNIIAVCGSHGKTTTTGFLEQIFLPLNPTVHIGGKLNGENGHIGGNDIFITEACEYKRSFLHLSPDITIFLNAELDHTDYYRDFDDYFSAFEQFASQSKCIIVNGDDENCQRLKCEKKVTFGLKEHNDFRAVNIEKTQSGYDFDIERHGVFLLRARINIHGRHNVYNALSAVCAAFETGVDSGLILKGLENFGGVKRRFEYRGNVKGAKVFCDYAHHPSEIKTTILSARETGAKKVTVIFEPHTYSRTKSLQDGFIQSLSGADRVILVPIYPAREAPLEGVTSHNLVRGLINEGIHAVHCGTFCGACKYLSDTAAEGETIVFTGAGDIEKAADNFMEN